MPRNSPVSRRVVRTLVSGLLAGILSAASDVVPPRLYQVTTETGMPHLDENLRYTITHEHRCLAQRDLVSAFPIMNHSALKGCSLAEQSNATDTLSFDLVCSGGHGTTGNATWHLGASQLDGTLNVKLGGKNMTFYQRITAIAVGACGT